MRLGRYGAFAQIGSKDAGDTPRYASLRPGQSMHTIALADALELFKLPRDLGHVAGGRRRSASASAASVRSSSRATPTPRSSPEDDPYTIDLAQRARALVQEKREAAANRIIRDFGNGVQVLNGRYGPYITDGEKNARIPKEREPATPYRRRVRRPARGGAVPSQAWRRAQNAKAAPAKKTAAKKRCVSGAGQPATPTRKRAASAQESRGTQDDHDTWRRERHPQESRRRQTRAGQARSPGPGA